MHIFLKYHLLKMSRQAFELLCFSTVLICFLLFNVTYAMTRQQLKNSGKIMKKSCIPKNDVTEEQVGSIEQGKFIEERNVMCYIACIYTVSQVVKNNKLNHDSLIKQVDMMFPPDMRDAVKAMAEKCKDVSKKYKDICEASYWTAKCMYEADPANFVFP